MRLGREGGGVVVGCGGVSEELCVCVFHGSGVGLMGWRLGCDWNIAQKGGGGGGYLRSDRESYKRGVG